MSELSEREQAELQALVEETKRARVRLLNASESKITRVKENIDDNEYARRLARQLQRDSVIVKKVKADRIAKSSKEWRDKVGPTFAEATTDHPVILDRINRLVSGAGTHKTSLVLSGDMGVGKAQPLSEPVLTLEGFKPMRCIKPGDKVIGSNGKPTTVKAIYPQGVRSIYKVSFNDGSFTFADGDHLWTVETGNLKRYGKTKVLSTKDLLESGILDSSGNRKYGIPMVSPVEFEEKKYIISPYILGILLGDGYLGRQNISISTNDIEIFNKVDNEKPDGVCLNRTDNHYLDFRFSRKTSDGIFLAKTNLVKDEIRRLGLYEKKSFDKFIPTEYLLGSIEQRIELLRGLMDSDGEVSKNHSWVGYSTASPQLAEDVAQLVRSLGGVTRTKLRTNIKNSNYDSYRITVTLKDINPFYLPRKALIYKQKTKYLPARKISSIIYTHEEEAQCISVEAEDNLYVTRNYIVTHNTWQAYSYLNLAIANGIATPGQIISDTETGVLGKITTAGYKKAEMLDELLNDRNKIWFIDDVGQGFFNDKQKQTEVWFELLDHIYTHQLTLLITTNLRVSRNSYGNQASPLENWIGPRAFDRLRALVGPDGFMEPSKVNRRDAVMETQERKYQGKVR